MLNMVNNKLNYMQIASKENMLKDLLFIIRMVKKFICGMIVIILKEK